MTYEIKPAEKGFTLIWHGLELGTAKLHCDAVLIAKSLDRVVQEVYDRAYAEGEQVGYLNGSFGG